MADAAEKLSFNADVARLLDIVAHALYSHRDVFLRELISNAADACDRLRYDSLSQPQLTSEDTTFRIHVFPDRETRTLTVADNGIGMTREELIKNLGTIAWSGTAALMEQIGKAKTEGDKLNLIGQFGVGFYASFMVATNVHVISRKAGESQTWVWESDGRSGFSVREATKEEAAIIGGSGRGTTILLSINDDSSEYLIEEKLKQVITTYSDHVNVPIFLTPPGETKQEDKPVNAASALWTKAKNDITDEQYKEFYKHITHGFDDPIMTSHWHAEGKIEYNALLFAPTLRPWDLYDPTRKHAVRLYVRRVFIADGCEGLVYPWLRFLRGIVDSEDLPLNISREMLQHNPVVTKIRNGIAKRILSDLDKLSKEDPTKYAMLWGQFGPVIKEGLYDAQEHREDLLKIVRFLSTNAVGPTSLDEYESRMKPGQSHIYYISGANLDTLRNSPQIEGFIERGIEVLFFTDTIDDFWLQTVQDYKGKAFKSVTKGAIDLGALSDLPEAIRKEPANDSTPQQKESIAALATAITKILSDDVGEVRTTTRLTNSPVCLVAADNEVDLRMEQVLRIHQKYEPQSKRILEINGDHPLIQRLAALHREGGDSGPDLTDAAHLLLDQARIIQGEPIPDPASFARRLSRFMEQGLA